MKNIERSEMNNIECNEMNNIECNEMNNIERSEMNNIEQSEMNNIVETFANPSRYTQAPFGTIHKHEDKYFIQVSPDNTTPNWITLENFFLEVNLESIKNNDFMSNQLSIYLKKKGLTKTNVVEFTTKELK